MTTNTTITPELLDQLLANYEKPEDLTGEGGLFKQLKKALIERALGAELTEHLREGRSRRARDWEQP
jgi:putative transposase